ncbi:MAG: Sec-independent protein translocase subunit TatA/TatB, partial [Candidatus Zixiibacteriota bacterium]
MFGLGTGEIILIFVAILLLFGAKRLPEVAQG